MIISKNTKKQALNAIFNLISWNDPDSPRQIEPYYKQYINKLLNIESDKDARIKEKIKKHLVTAIESTKRVLELNRELDDSDLKISCLLEYNNKVLKLIEDNFL